MIDLPLAPQPAAAGAAHSPAFPILVMLIIGLQFSPMIGLLGFQLNQDTAWSLIGGLRDVAVVLLAGLAVVGGGQRQALPVSARWALLTLGVYAVFALASGNGLVVLALNIRRMGLMPLLFVAVLAMPWTAAQIDRLFALLVSTSVVVCLLGIAERLAPQTLWSDVLDVTSFTTANGLDRFGKIAFQDSGRFFSWDLQSWTGGPLRRMVSTYLEPTTLAAAMAMLLVVALARRARGHHALGLIVLALLCGAATLSKGFVLFLGVLLAWRGVGLPSPRHVMALSLAVLGAAWAAANLELGGVLLHAEGLASSLQYLANGNLLGEGIGGAGNYTDTGNNLGEESGLGNLIAQVGIAGVLPLAWVSVTAREMLATAARRHDPGGSWLAAWLVFWALSFLLSASSLGVGGNALGFIAMALYLHPASEPAAS